MTTSDHDALDAARQRHLERAMLDLDAADTSTASDMVMGHATRATAHFLAAEALRLRMEAHS